MRRVLAGLLLVLWMAGVCLPLLQAQPNVPACCRRGGTHHCAAPGLGEGYRSTALACPYRHRSALTSQSAAALPVSATVISAKSRSTDLVCRASSDITRQTAGTVPQRGPPSSDTLTEPTLQG